MTLPQLAVEETWASAYGSVSVLVSRSTQITSCGGSYKSKYRESTPRADIAGPQTHQQNTTAAAAAAADATTTTAIIQDNLH